MSDAEIDIEVKKCINKLCATTTDKISFIEIRILRQEIARMRAKIDTLSYQLAKEKTK
jgi:hypothetical protein